MDCNTFTTEIQKFNYIANTTNLDKTVYNIYELEYDGYILSVISNKIICDNTYETYLCFHKINKQVTNVLYRLINNKEENNLYFNKLKELVDSNNLGEILRLVKNN